MPAVRPCDVDASAAWRHRHVDRNLGTRIVRESRRELAPLEPVDDVVAYDTLVGIGHRTATLHGTRISTVAPPHLVAECGAADRACDRCRRVAAPAADLVSEQAAGDSADNC